MSEKTTGAMAEFGTPPSPNRGGPVAGLVLLYAESYAELPPVWLLDKDHMRIGRDEGTDIRMSVNAVSRVCLLYTSPSPRDRTRSRMPSSA